MPGVINGLILIGGQSQRMGADKAFLTYHDRPQLDVTFDLLKPYCDGVFISKRSDQTVPEKYTAAVIDDVVAAKGPMTGIISAFHTYSGGAWLVLACDLPFLDDEAIRYLLEKRDPARLATAYRSVYTGDPEPLCAIYESGMADVLKAALAQDHMCPRRVIKEQNALLLDPPNKLWLENVNTPEEKQAVARKIRAD
jgi:molybdopterin-guanine dinucleotide biosynthesis protein A